MVENFILVTSNFRLLYVNRTSMSKTLENCELALSTGLSIFEMQQTGFLCGAVGHKRVINQKGIKTRFIRLNPNCDVIALCEVEVYGRPGKPYSNFYIKLFNNSSVYSKMLAFVSFFIIQC